ncbi:RTA1 like protein-domain-containing protein [Xylogone sp. PMI_703]|nr:RTA1 like protein-domain-containing protein [Xylogone sp. PMI_703]
MTTSNSDSNSDNDIWLSNPNLPLTIIGAVLFSIPMVIQFIQTVLVYKSYHFIVVFIGACLEVGGYIARAVSIKQKDSIPPYAVQSSLIVIAPLFVGAGNYLLISRLCLMVLPQSITKIYRIPTAHLTRIFIICDIISFLIQVSGSGIASSGNWEGSTVTVGEDVLIVGLASQVATFIFFLAIVSRFHRLTKVETIRDDQAGGWRVVLKAVYISSTLILIRSIYRLMEFAWGIHGYLFTHEWMFFVLEALPMLPAISVFCIWHPAKYMHVGRKRAKLTSDVLLESNDDVRTETVTPKRSQREAS